MIDQDPGRGLRMVAHAVSVAATRARSTDELIAHLRNGFLALMAPELVQLPGPDVDAVGRAGPPARPARARPRDRGARRGARRDAPRARPACPARRRRRAAHGADGVDRLAALADRLQRLEQGAAAEAPSADAAASPRAASPVPARPAAAGSPVDPSTGRAAVGGRANERRRRWPAPPDATLRRHGAGDEAAVAHRPTRRGRGGERSPPTRGHRPVDAPVPATDATPPPTGHAGSGVEPAPAAASTASRPCRPSCGSRRWSRACAAWSEPSTRPPRSSTGPPPRSRWPSPTTCTAASANNTGGGRGGVVRGGGRSDRDRARCRGRDPKPGGAAGAHRRSAGGRPAAPRSRHPMTTSTSTTWSTHRPRP